VAKEQSGSGLRGGARGGQVSGSKLGELRMERGEGQGPRAPDMLPNLRAPLDPSADRMREGMRNSLAPEGNRGTSLTGLPPEGFGWRVNGRGSGERGGEIAEWKPERVWT
jgi:hypothetical protein